MRHPILSRLLKQARTSRGWSQVEVADYLHIHRNTYASYEQGEAEPGLTVGLKIMRLLGIDPSTLHLYEDTHKEKPKVSKRIRTESLVREGKEL